MCRHRYAHVNVCADMGIRMSTYVQTWVFTSQRMCRHADMGIHKSTYACSFIYNRKSRDIERYCLNIPKLSFLKNASK